MYCAGSLEHKLTDLLSKVNSYERKGKFVYLKDSKGSVKPLRLRKVD